MGACPGRLPDRDLGRHPARHARRVGCSGAWLGLPAVFVIAGLGGIVLAAITWVVLHAHRLEIAAAFAGD